MKKTINKPSLYLFFLLGLTILFVIATVFLMSRKSNCTGSGCKKTLLSSKNKISPEESIDWRDEHDCLINDGFTWCAERNKCLREWEEPCNKDASSSASAQETGSATRVAFALIRMIKLPSDLLMPKEMNIKVDGKEQVYKGLGFDYPAPHYTDNVETKANSIKEYMTRNGFQIEGHFLNKDNPDFGRTVYKKIDVLCSLHLQKLENIEKDKDFDKDDDSRDNTGLIKNVENPEGLTFELSCADIKDEYIKKEE